MKTICAEMLQAGIVPSEWPMLTIRQIKGSIFHPTDEQGQIIPEWIGDEDADWRQLGIRQMQIRYRTTAETAEKLLDDERSIRLDIQARMAAQQEYDDRGNLIKGPTDEEIDRQAELAWQKALTARS